MPPDANRSSRSDVAIRPYARDDLAMLQRLLGDPEMTVHFGGPESPEAIQARHERYLGAAASTAGLFTIVVGREQTAAGWVGYWELEWQGEQVWECGWHVLPEFQGAGIGTTAVILMLARVRERARFRFVHAFPSVDNAASNALCRRLGFKLLGAVEIEYPKGRAMRANDWRLDLFGDSAN